MKTLFLTLILVVLAPFAFGTQGKGVSTYDTDNFTIKGDGAGGDTVGTLPLTVQSHGKLKIVTRSDGRVGVTYNNLVTPANDSGPDHTVNWKSGGLEHHQNWYRGANETTSDFGQRMKRDLDDLLEIFPKDP